MADTNSGVNAMLFNYETTYRTDFRFGTIKNLIYTKYQPKKTCVRVRPPPLKDVHTLSDWKDTVIPFSLLHKPKEIIRTDPYRAQEILETTKDEGLPEAIRTRPRLVMTPAVSMDDIEDPHLRSLLINTSYISSTMKAQREVEKPYFCVKAPLPKMPAPAKPVKLPMLQPGLVSPEWRMESVSWDQKQTRTYCDPTKEFWKRRDTPQCQKCGESAAVQVLRKTREMMNETVTKS